MGDAIKLTRQFLRGCGRHGERYTSSLQECQIDQLLTLKKILIMVPTKEMLEAYFKEMSHNNEDLERMWFWAGVAAYAHLQSPASEQWKREHGFKTEEQ